MIPRIYKPFRALASLDREKKSCKFNNLVIRYCLYQVTGKQNNLFCNKYNSLPNLKLDHVSLRSNLDYYGLANTVTYCLESHN